MPWPSPSPPESPPQAGLYTAVVAGFLISALGGSRTQIGGPTGAFVVIVAGIVARFGIDGLALVSLMAGVILLVMGLTGLGSAVKFIPRAVTIGFTNGIAMLIASTQIKDFFGLKTPAVPSEFLPRMARARALRRNHPLADPRRLRRSLAIILLWPSVTRRIPGSIVALLLHRRRRAAPSPRRDHRQPLRRNSRGLPHFALPHFRAEHILPLLPCGLHRRHAWPRSKACSPPSSRTA